MTAQQFLLWCETFISIQERNISDGWKDGEWKRKRNTRAAATSKRKEGWETRERRKKQQPPPTPRNHIKFECVLFICDEQSHARNKAWNKTASNKKEEWNQKLDIILIGMCHSYQCQKWNYNRIPGPEESSCLLHVPHCTLGSNTNKFFLFLRLWFHFERLFTFLIAYLAIWPNRIVHLHFTHWKSNI